MNLAGHVIKSCKAQNASQKIWSCKSQVHNKIFLMTTSFSILWPVNEDIGGVQDLSSCDAWFPQTLWGPL